MDWMRISEASRKYNIPKTSLYELYKKGFIKGEKRDKINYYDPLSIEQYLENTPRKTRAKNKQLNLDSFIEKPQQEPIKEASSVKKSKAIIIIIDINDINKTLKQLSNYGSNI
jgi:hypothetical protein